MERARNIEKGGESVCETGRKAGVYSFSQRERGVVEGEGQGGVGRQRDGERRG